MKVETERLLGLAKDPDSSRMQDYVTEYRNKCMDLWTDASRDEFLNAVGLLEQSFARVERTLGNTDERERTLYHVGRMQGILQVFKQLVREGRKDEDVAELMDRHDDEIDRIMSCLYAHEGRLNMRRDELMRTTGLPDDNLDDAMEQILVAGAAECYRMGKDIIYVLTKAGRRYCKERMDTK